MNKLLMLTLFAFGITLGLCIGQHLERERAKPTCNQYGVRVYPQTHLETVCDNLGRPVPCVGI